MHLSLSSLTQVNDEARLESFKLDSSSIKCLLFSKNFSQLLKTVGTSLLAQTAQIGCVLLRSNQENHTDMFT